MAKVGRTGIAVSRLALGTGFLGGLGETVAAARFAETVAAAWAAGVTYFDTAPIYGLGVSEERLGSALADRPRAQYVVSSKIGRLLRAPGTAGKAAELDRSYEGAWRGVPPRDLVVDFSHDGALRSVEESLTRLGLSRLDIVYIHDTFEEHQYVAAMGGAYPALSRLRDEGIVGALGVGIGRIDMLERYARDGDFDCFLVAGRYTLLDHAPAANLVATCRRKSISITAGGVFNSGILADPWRERASFDYRPAEAAIVERARRLDGICAAHGVPLKAAALQFPLAEPAVASVVMGASRPQEVEDNVALASLAIPAALWRDLATAGLIAEGARIPSV
jgi:D-threo-aldose 1-dehydrogenase